MKISQELRKKAIHATVAIAAAATLGFAGGWQMGSEGGFTKGYIFGDQDGYSIGYNDGRNGEQPGSHRLMTDEDYSLRTALGGREIGQ